MSSKTVHFVSLGCPKNRVDSEVMLGHLANDGFTAVNSPEGADVIVVNTCAFIAAAKEESVDTILEMARYKTQGAQKLVVAGCMSQRYAPDLAKEIPEVDHFLGTGNFESIGDVLKGVGPKNHPSLPILGVGSSGTRNEATKAHPRLVGKNKLIPYRHVEGAEHARVPDPDFTLSAHSPRMATLAKHMSYVKVSEGCSNTCAFCIIPKLRGPQRSRPIDDIVREVEGLLEKGTLEINLIAQDLCAFGKDREPRESLAQLLKALDGFGGNYWVRCLYAYPKGLTQDVMDMLGSATHVLPYLDMPLQHIADGILTRMKRGKGGPATWELLRRLRQSVPNLTLRTTFITGLPGESDADFEELVEFAKEIRFERLGVFSFSPEEDTPAATMPDQVTQELADERRDYLMGVQLDISKEQQQSLLGQTMDVVVEGVSEETELLLVGRHKGQAPEIDGLTYITAGTAKLGDVVKIEVTEAGDYDVAGPIVGQDGEPAILSR